MSFWRSTCCGGSFAEPGWPDNDCCSRCGEHTSAYDEELEEDLKQLNELAMEANSYDNSRVKQSTESIPDTIGRIPKTKA